MSVPNLSNFLLSLNKNDKALLADLKTLLNDSLKFFPSNYVNDCSDSVELDDKCKILITSGYEYFFKITSYLKMLRIVDSSQTNKYKYEENLELFIGMDKYLDSVHDIYIVKYDLDIQKLMSLSKIEKNSPTYILGYSETIDSKKSMLLTEKINVFNHYINTYISLIIQVIQNLKYTSIN